MRWTKLQSRNLRSGSCWSRLTQLSRSQELLTWLSIHWHSLKSACDWFLHKTVGA